MPQQIFGRDRESEAIVKDTFQIFHLDVVFVNGVDGEEAGRRHLFGIAYDDYILASGDGAYRFVSRHL